MGVCPRCRENTKQRSNQSRQFEQHRLRHLHSGSAKRNHPNFAMILIQGSIWNPRTVLPVRCHISQPSLITDQVQAPTVFSPVISSQIIKHPSPYLLPPIFPAFPCHLKPWISSAQSPLLNIPSTFHCLKCSSLQRPHLWVFTSCQQRPPALLDPIFVPLFCATSRLSLGYPHVKRRSLFPSSSWHFIRPLTFAIFVIYWLLCCSLHGYLYQSFLSTSFLHLRGSQNPWNGEPSSPPSSWGLATWASVVFTTTLFIHPWSHIIHSFNMCLLSAYSVFSTLEIEYCTKPCCYQKALIFEAGK